MKEVATIPSYCCWKDRVMDVGVYHSEYTEWSGQVREHFEELGWGPSTVDKVIREMFPSNGVSENGR